MTRPIAPSSIAQPAQPALGAWARLEILNATTIGRQVPLSGRSQGSRARRRCLNYEPSLLAKEFRGLRRVRSLVCAETTDDEAQCVQLCFATGRTCVGSWGVARILDAVTVMWVAR